MKVEQAGLGGGAPGTSHAVPVYRFGAMGARPKVYVQAGLHADEVPGMLVARRLIELLTFEEAAGRIVGEVVVVPLANPIGLAQRVLGQASGRFALADGQNFNRGYPDLAGPVGAMVSGQLSEDPGANVATIRAALRQANSATVQVTPLDVLRAMLLDLALDADQVFDLHCENEGAVHLYTLPGLAERCRPLAGLLGAAAVLVADSSGGNPFDEACSRPWQDLQDRFPGWPVPLACCAVTVELRGERDVGRHLADADAGAILGAMVAVGAVDGSVPDCGAPCEATALADVEPVVAPTPGIFVPHAAVGDRVESGDLVAEIVDPATGMVSQLRARHGGVMFARESARFVIAGRSVAKIAGIEAGRTGPLLGA